MQTNQNSNKQQIKSTRTLHSKNSHAHLSHHNHNTGISQHRFKSQESIKFNSSDMDEQKIQAQLIKQIANTKKIIQAYQNNLKPVTYTIKKKTTIVNIEETLEELRGMEENINNKDYQIKKINEEIRILKSAPDQLRKDAVKQYRSLKDAQLFILADQILTQKQQLINLQKIHAKKKQEHIKRQQNMHKLSQNYIQLAKSTGKSYLTYKQFLKQKKQKEDQLYLNHRNKKQSKKLILPIKQQTNIEMESSNNNNNNKVSITSHSNTSLKDVLSKKQKTEAVLKTAKKKHNSEIAELRAKLDFLRDEDEELENKLAQKMRELNAADHRFSEAALRGSQHYGAKFNAKNSRERKNKIKKLDTVY